MGRRAALLGLPSLREDVGFAICVNVCILMSVTPRTRYNFFIDDDQRDGLREVKERDGIPESEQIRRAIDRWLDEKGVRKTADRARAKRARKA